MKKCSLFMDTIQGKRHNRPPVWFMRQAGRSLPSYQKLKERYSFKELMQDPQLACDVTLLPVWDLGVDAAILFSDILVIPEALGMHLEFEDKGPIFKDPLAYRNKPEKYLNFNPDTLTHIYEAIKKIQKNKPDEIALIGFAGGPFTVLCYMLQGTSYHHTFPDAIKFIFQRVNETKILLEIISEATIQYAKKQITSGIDVFQIFETHAGLIPSKWYSDLVLPYIEKIAKAVRETNTPVIFFPRGYGSGLKNLTITTGDIVGVDWQVDLYEARKMLNKDIGIQGNLDPRILLTDQKTIKKELEKFKSFGATFQKWIFNLGHGLLPDTPIDNIKFVVEWIKNSDWKVY